MKFYGEVPFIDTTPMLCAYDAGSRGPFLVLGKKSKQTSTIILHKKKEHLKLGMFLLLLFKLNVKLKQRLLVVDCADTKKSIKFESLCI